MKKVISLSEYESLYEHLERSEAWIAVDATWTRMTDVRAIFLGESWGRLKRLFEVDEWPELSDFHEKIDPIWKTFFSEPMPSLLIKTWGELGYETDIDYHEIGLIFQKIARAILDAVYEIEGDNE